MDFDLNWNLFDARYVTDTEYNSFILNPNDNNNKKLLENSGKSYTKSLNILNSFCKKELIDYRTSLTQRKFNESDQKFFLNELYQKYLNEFKKH